MKSVDYLKFIKNPDKYTYTINESSAAYKNFANKILSGSIKVSGNFRSKQNKTLFVGLFFFIFGVLMGLTIDPIFFTLSFEFMLHSFLYNKIIDDYIHNEGVYDEKIFNILVANNVISSENNSFKFYAPSNFIFKNKVNINLIILVILIILFFLYIIYDDSYINNIDKNLVNNKYILRYNTLIEYVSTLKSLR